MRRPSAYFVCGVVGAVGSALLLIFCSWFSREFVVGAAVALASVYLLTGLLIAWFGVRRRDDRVAVLLLFPSVIVVLGWLIALTATVAYTRFGPDTPSWHAACRQAGASYFGVPRDPVRSIAIDWDSDEKPSVWTFDLDGRSIATRLTSPPIRFALPSLAFVEWKNDAQSQIDGAFAYWRDDFERKSKSGVDTLTADVLVSVHATPAAELHRPIGLQETVRYEVTVTDRRNATRLATLVYAVDHRWNRACGESSTGRMSVEEFVGTAIRHP